MEYTVNKLAQLSGVSARTLRYYDQIGLLKPARICANGYRMYGKHEVDVLQQVLFYRELGVSLDEIKTMLSAPDYDREKTLRDHLSSLMQKKSRIETLIANVKRTIDASKGMNVMNDQEKFEGFKQKLIDENERKYGEEIRNKYGDDAVASSNARLMGMNAEDLATAEQLSAQIQDVLKEAIAIGDPSCEPARRASELHKKWICLYWKEGTYSSEAHKALAEMYVADERFRAYYDNIAEGAAVFLRNAIYAYCGE